MGAELRLTFRLVPASLGAATVVGDHGSNGELVVDIELAVEPPLRWSAVVGDLGQLVSLCGSKEAIGKVDELDKVARWWSEHSRKVLWEWLDRSTAHPSSSRIPGSLSVIVGREALGVVDVGLDWTIRRAPTVAEQLTALPFELLAPVVWRTVWVTSPPASTALPPTSMLKVLVAIGDAIDDEADVLAADRLDLLPEPEWIAQRRTERLVVLWNGEATASWLRQQLSTQRWDVVIALGHGDDKQQSLALGEGVTGVGPDDPGIIGREELAALVHRCGASTVALIACSLGGSVGRAVVGVPVAEEISRSGPAVTVSAGGDLTPRQGATIVESLMDTFLAKAKLPSGSPVSGGELAGAARTAMTSTPALLRCHRRVVAAGPAMGDRILVRHPWAAWSCFRQHDARRVPFLLDIGISVEIDFTGPSLPKVERPLWFGSLVAALDPLWGGAASRTIGAARLSPTHDWALDLPGVEFALAMASARALAMAAGAELPRDIGALVARSVGRPPDRWWLYGTTVPFWAELLVGPEPSWVSIAPPRFGPGAEFALVLGSATVRSALPAITDLLGGWPDEGFTLRHATDQDRGPQPSDDVELVLARSEVPMGISVGRLWTEGGG